MTNTTHTIGFTLHNGWLQPVQEEHITGDGPPCTIWRIGHPGFVVLQRPWLCLPFGDEATTRQAEQAHIHTLQEVLQS